MAGLSARNEQPHDAEMDDAEDPTPRRVGCERRDRAKQAGAHLTARLALPGPDIGIAGLERAQQLRLGRADLFRGEAGPATDIQLMQTLDRDRFETERRAAGRT